MMSRPAPSSSARRVDLHTHTTCSDGRLTPEELVRRAEERGLAALAITDHDTLDALPRAAAVRETLELVPGLEMSTALDGLDLHLLGYFVDPEHAELRERLRGFREDRIQRAHLIIERLAKLGVPVEEARVRERAAGGVVGRPHVAAELVEAGHVDDMDDAFRRFLAAGGPAYVPRPAFHPHDAIRLIHAAGGVSVLAHPGSSVPDRTIEHLAEGGLRGVEIWHPQHGVHAIRRLRSLAHRLGLIETGGSDYHGAGRAVDLGDIFVPVAVLTQLKEAAGVSG
jgi:predicted metal-dependent phosphoesterase TrpH